MAEVVPDGYVATLFDLTGRTAVVTGAGSGLGEAISLGLAQAGAAVAALDISVDGARRVADQVVAAGGRAVAVAADVTDKDALERALDVVETLGPPDILVNSAGSAFRSPAEEFPEDRWDFIIDLNLKGTFLASQVFGALMLERGRGSIINLTSIGSEAAYPLASAYQASKGGVKQLTKALALEWRDRGVRVNCIGPTLMDSPLTKSVAQSTTVTADFIKARMLRPRLGLPRELIGAAIFLAGDASELVTGHNLLCDDGYTIA